MAKGKGKKRRSPSDMARLEFRKKHGRWPAKGELAGKRSRPARSRSSSGSTDPDASGSAAAKRRRAAKKAAKTRSSWRYRVKKAVTDHPVRSLLVAAGIGGAAYRPTREMAVDGAKAGLARARAFVKK